MRGEGWWTLGACSGHRVSGGTEGAGEPDQGQAGDGRVVVAVDPVEQGDASGFELVRTGAVDWLIGGDVTFDFIGEERPHGESGHIDM